MTRATTPLVAILGAVALAAGLFGCAAGTTAGGTESSAAESAAPGECAEVAVVINFGPIDGAPITDCVAAGVARDVLSEAGATTEGTLDYGDQVVCRVNDRPGPSEQVTIAGQSPFVESCATLSATAYWAVWVKTSPGSEWEYAQEGVSTLQLTDGQSLGLVYTPGTDTVLPQG